VPHNRIRLQRLNLVESLKKSDSYIACFCKSKLLTYADSRSTVELVFVSVNLLAVPRYEK